jgi:hypothetical protein
VPAVGGKISSASESPAPFEARGSGSGRDEFFFDPEIFRGAGRFTVFRTDFSRFAFGFLAEGRLALAGFFGEGRAPRRACFLE